MRLLFSPSVRAPVMAVAALAALAVLAAPSSAGAQPGGPPPPPLYTEPTGMQVSVTPPSGETASGALVRLTDFEVTLYEKSSGRMRSWLRNGDVPKVVVTDPLQAHVDQLPKWTDADMHNMTAYLASLK